MAKRPQTTQMGRDPRQTPAVPIVDPRVTDPAARRYAEAAARRRAPSRYEAPVGGAPAVSIPRLDGDFQQGKTMAEQAPKPTAPPLGGIIEGQPTSFAHPQSGAALGLLPSDILPEIAQQDPEFKSGHGSMFAASQPNLAKKYGVVRNGQMIPAQVLFPRPEGKGLRKETLEGLKAVEEFNRKRSQVEDRGRTEEDLDQKIEDDASQGLAGSNTEIRDGRREKPLSDSEIKEVLDNMDEFDLTRFKDVVMRDLLNNEEQRKLIESRLQPLDLGELVTTGRVTQIVPIIPGKLEPEFQSYSGIEDLALKRLLASEVKQLEPSDRYVLDKYTLMGLALCLKSVNKRQLPDHEDSDGSFNEDNFWKKFNVVSKFNFHMLASLSINWFWFDMRVRKMFVAEKLGNG